MSEKVFKNRLRSQARKEPVVPYPRAPLPGGRASDGRFASYTPSEIEPVSSGLSEDHQPRVPGRVHVLAYVLLAGVCLWGLVGGWSRPVVCGDVIAVEPALVRRVEQQIDPNTAPWPELARLPGIGEVLARRIVAYREERRAGPGGERLAAVFSKVEDLDPVHGIGPKTLDQLAEGLKFPAAEAGESH